MEIAESEKSKKVDEAQSVKCKFDFEWKSKLEINWNA
jgi:hypothetical protein